MAGTEYYDSSGTPATRSQGSSASMRAEFDAIQAGFDKMPGLAGNGNRIPHINAGGTAQTTTSGFTMSAGGALTVPNGVTVTAGGLIVTAGGLTVTAGGLTVSAGAASLSGGALTASPANANVAISPTGTGTVTISPANGLTMAPGAASSLSPTAGGLTLNPTGGMTFGAAVTAVTWSGNPTHSGNHVFSGNLTVQGNTQIGNAAGDTLTIDPNAVTWTNNPTHSGNHTFSGNVVIQGNTTIGNNVADQLTIHPGTVVLQNALTFTLSTVSFGGFGAGLDVYIGDSANAFSTVGLTINQDAADDELLAFKSNGDVAHGITDLTETDTFASFSKSQGAAGGLRIDGWSSGTRGIHIVGNHTTDDTTKSTAGNGAIDIRGTLKSGTTVTDLGANANILVVRNRTTTRFILDADGDSHQDVGTAWTNFDFVDDMQVMDALAVSLHRGREPLKIAFARSLVESRDFIERLPGKPLVTYNEDGHHFANMSQVTMLHHGAIRQLGREQRENRERLDHLLGEVAAVRAQMAQLERRLPALPH